MDIHNKKKISLVLSGGGIKAAAFHIGACLALREKGFTFSGGSKDSVSSRSQNPDQRTRQGVVNSQKAKATQANTQTNNLDIKLYVGSSAGSFVSAVLASGHSLEALITAFQVGVGSDPYYKIKEEEKLYPIGYRHLFNLKSKRLLSFLPQTFIEKSIITGGLETFLKKGFKLNGFFNTNGIERYSRKYILTENEFSRLGAELYIVSTQLNHSRKTIFGPYLETFKNENTLHIGHAKISEAIASSVALPPIFAPYPINMPDGKEIYHYDGEIRDTLSTHVAADHGSDMIIASYSMQPYHYSKEMGSLHKYGIPAIINQALYQVLEQKVKRHIQFHDQKRSTYIGLKKLCAEEKLSTAVTKKILTLVEDSLTYNDNVDYLYISPLPEDYQMFFADHFSLNPKILEKIVWCGFKAGISKLRRVV